MCLMVQPQHQYLYSAHMTSEIRQFAIVSQMTIAKCVMTTLMIWQKEWLSGYGVSVICPHAYQLDSEQLSEVTFTL